MGLMINQGDAVAMGLLPLWVLILEHPLRDLKKHENDLTRRY
jgi:hypothetical protein